MSSFLVMLVVVAGVCAAQAFRDFRRKDYVWAALSAAAVLAILLIPIPSHSVVVDLDRPSAR